MSKYLGPIYKKAKRLDVSLLEDNREFRSKQRSKSKRKVGTKRVSAFGAQLKEKQKMRFRYFLTEQQFRNLFVKVQKNPGQKGENLFFALESRLDNLLYRAGITTTRLAARQLVNHNHILVNNHPVNIPSYFLKINDIITFKKPRFRKQESIKTLFTQPPRYQFLALDKNNFAIKLLRLPNTKEIRQDIKLPLIVEYFNRYL